jgi:uncharacterized protein (TIGR02996 family)
MGLFHWLRRTFAGAHAPPPNPQYRRYEVAVFDEPLGTFTLPVGDHLAAPHAFPRPLLTRPFRVDFLDEWMYHWVERHPNGTFKTVTWHPETAESRAEAARLYDAAHGRSAAGADHVARQPPFPPRPPEEARLLRAILANRDTDQPYLDYAAWLTARGDTSGEYIRLTLEIERTPKVHADRERLEAGRAEIVQRDGPRWVLPLTDLGLYPGEYISCVDGFTPDIWYGSKGVIEELTIEPDAHVFPRNVPSLFHSAPFLRKLTIRSREVTVADIGTIPEWAEIEALDLSLADGTADDFRRFADAPHLGGLRELTLSGYRFGSAGADHLSRAAWLAGVRRVDLSGNAMGDSGAEALATSPNVANLTSAELADNEFTDRGLVALCASPHLARLTALHVARGRYSAVAARAVVGAPFAGALRSIDMTASGLDADGARAFAGGSFPALKALAVGFGKFGEEGFRALVSAPWFENLEGCRARDCEIGDGGALALATTDIHALRELDLGGNQIGDVGVAALAASKAFSRLTRLRLSDNPFGLAGVRALADTDLPALEELDLTGVDVGRAGAQALAASPFLNKLRRLTISEEYVGLVGRAALTDRFTERVVAVEHPNLDRH